MGGRTARRTATAPCACRRRARAPRARALTPHPPARRYNEGRGEGDQFFWNYLNQEAADYFVSSVTAVLAPDAVDGTFTDDVDGLPAEHPRAQANIGMSDDDLSALRFATQSTSQRLIDTLVAAGKYNWQAFGSRDTSVSARLGAGAGLSPATCAADVRALCNATLQAQPLLMKMASPGPDANQTLAAFLVVRPPHAYLGWAWESGDEKWTDLFLLQPGEPAGPCAETAPGVFERAWTAGVARLDCNKWEADLPFPSL